MRKKIYEVIESGNNNLHNLYDGVMIVTIILSLIPLVVKGGMLLFRKLDIVCAIIFAIDYFLRLITADYKYGEKSVKSFIRYPFSFYAIADLLSILPTFIALNQGLKLLRILRMVKAMRMFRIIKAVRYSKNLKILTNVFKNSKESLLAVFVFAIGYILVSALIVFNVEPQTFDSFFDAVYWATVSLTTIGYGDIYPVTFAGKIVTMVSSLLGIAIVALPAGIITAGYMKEIDKK